MSLALGIPVWLGVLLNRRIEASARRQLEELLEECKPPSCTSPNDAVNVLSYAYYGLLATLTTVKIEHRLPPQEALELVKKVHRFNLRWGWIAAGGFLVPLASTCRLWQQRRSIRKQLQRS